MVLTYSITPRDLIALDLYSLRKNFLRAFFRQPVGILATLLLFIISSHYYQTSRGKVYGTWVWGGSLVLLFLLLSVGELLLRRTRTAKSNPELLAERSLELGPDGVRTTVNGQVSILRWFAVKEIEKTRSHLFIVLNSTYSLIIPQTALGSAEAVDAYVAEFQKLRRKHIARGLAAGVQVSEADTPQNLGVSFTLNTEDAQAAYRLAVKEDSVNPKVLAGVFSGIGALVVGGLSFFIYDTWGNDPKVLRSLMLICGGIILFFGGFIALILWIQARAQARRNRAFAQSPNAKLAKQTVLLSTEGVLLSTVSGDNFLPWTDVHLVSKDDERLYLHLTPRWVCPVPRRAFESTGDMQAFVGFASSQWQTAQEA